MDCVSQQGLLCALSEVNRVFAVGYQAAAGRYLNDAKRSCSAFSSVLRTAGVAALPCDPLWREGGCARAAGDRLCPAVSILEFWQLIATFCLVSILSILSGYAEAIACREADQEWDATSLQQCEISAGLQSESIGKGQDCYMQARRATLVSAFVWLLAFV